jgi:hypothetical protein
VGPRAAAGAESGQLGCDDIVAAGNGELVMLFDGTVLRMMGVQAQ